MSHARFTENETGIEVDVETVFCWHHEEARQSIVESGWLALAVHALRRQ